MDLMPTLKGQLYRLPIDHLLSNGLSTLVFTSLFCFLAWFGRKSANVERWSLAGIAVTSFLGWAACPHGHGCDLIILIPAFAILIKQAAAVKNRFMLAIVWEKHDRASAVLVRAV